MKNIIIDLKKSVQKVTVAINKLEEYKSQCIKYKINK